MVSLRSGTDTEDEAGHEALSPRRTPASARRKARQGRAPQARTSLSSPGKELAVLSEEPQEGAGSDSCSEGERQLAQNMLSALDRHQEAQLRAVTGAGAVRRVTATADQSNSSVKLSGLQSWLTTALQGEQPTDNNVEGDTEADRLRWQPESQAAVLASSEEQALAEQQDAARDSPSQADVKQLSLGPLDKTYERRKALRQAPKTAGRDWFDLPRTHIDEKMKRDLRLLRLRAAMDTKRFYKTPDSTKFPTYFQVGTVVQGPTDFYGSRMTKKERRTSITEELLADQELKQQRKRRFGRLQAAKQAQAGRRGRKTENSRLKKRRQPPKH